MIRVFTFLAMFLIMAANSAAQVPGDWNGDGHLTAADYTGLESCWTGPVVGTGTVDPDCAAVFDPGGDGHISLRDALGLQPQVGVIGPCTLWSGSVQRANVRVAESQPEPNVYGILADIDTFDVPTLCTTVTDTTSLALSLRWVSILSYGGDDGVTPWFLQYGYGAGRNWDDLSPTNQTVPFCYVERKPPSGILTVITIFPDTAAGYHQLFIQAGLRPDSLFTLDWYPAPGNALASYKINDTELTQDSDQVLAGIPDEPALIAIWDAEVANTWDRFGGNRFAPVRFRTMEWAVGLSGNYVGLQTTPDEVQIYPPEVAEMARWVAGFAWTGGDSFEVWDFRN